MVLRIITAFPVYYDSGTAQGSGKGYYCVVHPHSQNHLVPFCVGRGNSHGVKVACIMVCLAVCRLAISAVSGLISPSPGMVTFPPCPVKRASREDNKDEVFFHGTHLNFQFIGTVSCISVFVLHLKRLDGGHPVSRAYLPTTLLAVGEW